MSKNLEKAVALQRPIFFIDRNENPTSEELGGVVMEKNGQWSIIFADGQKVAVPEALGRMTRIGLKIWKEFRERNIHFGNIHYYGMYGSLVQFDCHAFTIKSLGFNFSLSRARKYRLSYERRLFDKDTFEEVQSLDELEKLIRNRIGKEKVAVFQMQDRREKHGQPTHSGFFVLSGKSIYVIEKHGQGGIFRVGKLNHLYTPLDDIQHTTPYGNEFAVAPYLETASRGDLKMYFENWTNGKGSK